VLANIDGTTLTVRANSAFALNSANLGAQNVSSTVTATQALSALFLAQTAIALVLGNLGSDTRTITAQDSFLSKLSDAVTEGLGAIVDADLAKESALLQALQVQQQLAVQTLNIANQRPSILLNLFQ
jgi:flagellin